MVYRIRARYVGSLAGTLLEEGRAKVRHIFNNTIYLDVGNELLVITRKGFRAPMNIGVEDGVSFHRLVRPDEMLRLSAQTIRGENITINLDDASTYYYIPRIRGPKAGSIENSLVKGIFMVSLLYNSSDEVRAFYRSSVFERFLDGVVRPLAVGEGFEEDALHGLMGYGGGFTPSGDDILTGFLPTLWHLKGPKINMSQNVIKNATTWASGRLLRYASEGLIDEGLAGYISAVQEGEHEAALDYLLMIARRGHTSGLEISIGAILASSIACERVHGCGVLHSVLGKLIS